MKNTILIFILVFPFIAFCQDCNPPTANFSANENQISAHLNNNGALFYDGEDGIYIVPKDHPKQISSIFVNGLWLVSHDQGANFQVAGAVFGSAMEKHDYYPGPLKESGDTINEASCTNWDKIWKISRLEILDHIDDFEDNGLIDQPFQRIFSWPGRGNPFFESYNGFPLEDATVQLAPFFDADADNIYNPQNGDYPIISNSQTIPEEITWTIYNDAGNLHGETQGVPMHAEIQQMTWSFSCEEDVNLNNSLFLSYLVTNRAQENWDSTHIGFLTDFDLGCYQDDYLGCSPEHNTYYAYNKDNFDGAISSNDCFFGVDKSYGENPPAQGITFLNRSLDFFSYNHPQIFLDIPRQLTGTWADTHPFTESLDGTNPDAVVTSLLFTDLPTNETGWSMVTADIPASDQQAIASSKIGTIQPGESFQLDLVFVYHREPNANNLENVPFLLESVENIQTVYNNNFDLDCSAPLINNVKEATKHQFQIFPNPTLDEINITSAKYPFEEISVFSLNGQILRTDKINYSYETIINLESLESGFYILKIKSETDYFYHKIVKH